MQMSTSYGPDSVTTQTSPLPTSDPMASTLRSFLAERINRLRYPPHPVTASSPAPQQVGAPRRAISSDEEGSDSPRRVEQALLDKTNADAAMAEARQRAIAADEATRPAPMSFLPSGPGITGGYVMDPRAMDSAQRQMFLAKAAGMAPSQRPAEDDTEYSNAGRAAIARPGGYGFG